MSKKKNGGYGCGSIIAVMVICGFLAKFIPVAFVSFVIAAIVVGMYKYISRNKQNKGEIVGKEEDEIKKQSLVGGTYDLTESEFKEMVYRKNKLISEQNFDISEKNEIIDRLNKKIKEQDERYRKDLSEKNDLIFSQKLDISNMEVEMNKLKNTINELKKESDLESGDNYIKMEDLDHYTWEAALFICEKEKCNISIIQRRFMVGFERASRIVNELFLIGIIGEEEENGFEKVLIDKNEITKIYNQLIGGTLKKKRRNIDENRKRIIELSEKILELENDKRESEKLLKEYENEKNILSDKISETEKENYSLIERMSFQSVEIEKLAKEIGKIDDEHSERQSRLEREFQEKRFEFEEMKNEIESEILDIREELEILNNEAVEKYYDFSDYSSISSQDCMNQLLVLKTKENELRRSGDDVIIFDYSLKKKIVERSIRQILRNFNSDCDNIVMNIKAKNIDSMRDKIIKSYETLNNLYSKDEISLSENILSLKLEQATLLYTYELKRIEEKEIQQAIKEQMIEEAKAEREIEQQKKKVEKDLQQHLGEVNRLMKYMQKTKIDAERQLYIDKIKELEDKIKTLEVDKETVLEREANAKAGFVYIISNIGSFGENIYKIGMTRRLEPMDRVKELSSASVPFEFDVHAMIFSSDAPELENMLHKHFSDRAVNKVNPRKEFYNVDIDDIERVVKENYNDTVQFTKIPVATEYRQSINLGMSAD